MSIAGCVQVPISCKSNPAVSPVNIDISDLPSTNWDTDAADAANCLTHTTSVSGPNGGDTVVSSTVPFQFGIGTNDPVAVLNPSLAGTNTMISDSLVTVPVFDTGSYAPPTVRIIGFVQLFLNPSGTAATGPIPATVINLVGCGGTNVNATPIYGNGSSAVAVRLITPQQQ